MDLATQTRAEGLDKHLLIHRIARGEFTNRHPVATARLVIHLGSLTNDRQSWMWHHYSEFLQKLLAQDLPDDVEEGLREMMAKMGLN